MGASSRLGFSPSFEIGAIYLPRKTNGTFVGSNECTQLNDTLEINLSAFLSSSQPLSRLGCNSRIPRASVLRGESCSWKRINSSFYRHSVMLPNQVSRINHNCSYLKGATNAINFDNVKGWFKHWVAAVILVDFFLRNYDRIPCLTRRIIELIVKYDVFGSINSLSIDTGIHKYGEWTECLLQIEQKNY